MENIKFIYTANSDLDDELFYAEFETKDKAINYAMDHLDKLPFVDEVELVYNADGTEDAISYKTIWDHTMAAQEEVAAAEDEAFWDFRAKEEAEVQANKHDLGDTTWFESMNNLVEEMEENEDMVECKECFDLFPKADCVKLAFGYVCPHCNSGAAVADNDIFKIEFPEYKKFSDTTNDFDDSKLAMSDEDVARVNEPFEEPEFENDPISTPEEAVPFLVNDEVEAVAGYEKAAEVVADSDLENKEEILDTIDHIKKEEEEHIEELQDLMSDEKDDEIIEVENEPVSDEAKEVEETAVDVEESEVLVEETELKTWICWYEGKDIGTVEAATEEEAAERMMIVYPEYQYNNTDWNVELADEEYLTEHVNKECPAIESDQKLEGTDNAVVDCKVADVVTHSEDEKPVDCEGKKKPLEKPLTEKLDVTNGYPHIKSVATMVHKAVDNYTKDNRVATRTDGTSFYVMGDKTNSDPEKMKKIILDTLANDGYDPEVVQYTEKGNLYGYVIDKIRTTARITLSHKNEDLTEGLMFSLNNEKDLAEFTKLCREVGIKTIGDLDRFTKETANEPGNVLDKLRAYRKDLGADFKLKESAAKLQEDASCIAEYLGYYIYKDTTGSKPYWCQRGYADQCWDMSFASLAEIKDYIKKHKNDYLDEEDDDDYYYFESVKDGSQLKEAFTKEEQEEYNMDEDGNSLDSYDRYVRCTWCEEIFTEDQCVFEADMGWLCDRCYEAILSRGEKLTIIKNPTEEDEARLLTEDVEDENEPISNDPGEKPSKPVKMANTASTSGMDFESACKKYGIDLGESLEEAVGLDSEVSLDDLDIDEQEYIKAFTKFINDTVKAGKKITADDIKEFRNNYNKTNN
jgi:hypothetical protein